MVVFFPRTFCYRKKRACSLHTCISLAILIHRLLVTVWHHSCTNITWDSTPKSLGRSCTCTVCVCVEGGHIYLPILFWWLHGCSVGRITKRTMEFGSGIRAWCWQKLRCPISFEVTLLQLLHLLFASYKWLDETCSHTAHVTLFSKSTKISTWLYRCTYHKLWPFLCRLASLSALGSHYQHRCFQNLGSRWPFLTPQIPLPLQASRWESTLLQWDTSSLARGVKFLINAHYTRASAYSVSSTFGEV